MHRLAVIAYFDTILDARIIEHINGVFRRSGLMTWQARL